MKNKKTNTKDVTKTTKKNITKKVTKKEEPKNVQKEFNVKKILILTFSIVIGLLIIAYFSFKLLLISDIKKYDEDRFNNEKITLNETKAKKYISFKDIKIGVDAKLTQKRDNLYYYDLKDKKSVMWIAYFDDKEFNNIEPNTDNLNFVSKYVINHYDNKDKFVELSTLEKYNKMNYNIFTSTKDLTDILLGRAYAEDCEYYNVTNYDNTYLLIFKQNDKITSTSLQIKTKEGTYSINYTSKEDINLEEVYKIYGTIVI